MKEAFLYLNQLIYENYINTADKKGMEEELMRRFILLKPDEAAKIVDLFVIVRNNILRV